MNYLQSVDWSAVLAFVAICLSQLPPIKFWRTQNLKVEVLSRALLNHQIGSPGVSMVVGIRNAGGQPANIRSLRLILEREGTQVAELHATLHFPTPSSKESQIFVPVELPAGQTWTGSLVFLKSLKRAEEQEQRRLAQEMTKHIDMKMRARPPGDQSTVVADPEITQKFLQIYERDTIWVPGDYNMKLELVIDGSKKTFPSDYRFTVFDFEVGQLREQTEHYKLGWVHAPLQGVNVPTTLVS